ncbi:metalloregulator ArsR/SmtB family transcription factor [Patescibacteria group bacterium]
MFLSSTLSALSDPNRQIIIDVLKKRDMTVTDILKHIDVTMPTLSHHLDILKRADLVTSRRDGRYIIYSLNLSILDDVTAAITKLLSVRR